MAGGSQLQIQLPLSRLRTKLHPAALSHPFGENQDEPSLRLGRLVFISICRFGALRSVTCLVVLPGRSLREVPSQPGGAQGQPRPPGDGRWWGQGKALSPVPHPSAGGCVGEVWLPLPGERSACTGRDWGVLGALPRRGGLWDRGRRERRSTELDAAEVGAYLLPNSSFFPAPVRGRGMLCAASSLWAQTGGEVGRGDRGGLV